MKKHKLIGFALWTVANILLFLRLREYLMIAPVLAEQVVIWISCSVLFLMDVSSRGMLISKLIPVRKVLELKIHL